MPYTDANIVRAIYHGVLHREIESDEALQYYLNPSLDIAKTLQELLASAEFRQSVRLPFYDLWEGYGESDVALLRRHLVKSEPEAGYVKNFLGSRMRVELTSFTQDLSGVCYNEIPSIVSDYHAHPIEFVGTLKAIEAGSGPFVSVELGAGWGSWSVTSGLAARRAGRDPIRLYAVEASAGKVANMRRHFIDNGFDPDRHHLVHAVVGPTDGSALFPLVDVVGDWGGEAVFTDAVEEREGFEAIPSMTLETLLKDEKLVDLIHCDIQGAEATVVRAAAEMLTRKVRYMVIGTHSRSIEGTIHEVLSSRGWILENDQPSPYLHRPDGGSSIAFDGTQVWRNPQVA